MIYTDRTRTESCTPLKSPLTPPLAKGGRGGFVVFLLLFFFLTLSGCEKCAPPKKVPEEAKPVAAKPEEINLKETRFASIPEDYEQWGNISFSADGRQVFYVAGEKSERFIVVASSGGENIGPAYERVSFLVKSSDGRRFAFGGKKGEKKHLVIDNKELKEPYHEEVAPGAFSPDGRLVACQVGGLKERKWFISVSDGETEVYRSQAYPDTFQQPFFSPDGRLLVYELGDEKKRTVFFLDLAAKKIIRELPCADCDMAGKISFSSDSSRVVYGAGKEGEHFLVLHDFALDEERKIKFPYRWTGEFVLSPDGKRIIYIAIKEGKHYLVESPWGSPTQGKESGPYEAIIPPVFSPDSTTVAYHALKGGKWQSVAEDKESATNYDRVGGKPVFSPDGARIAYPAMKGSGGGLQGRRMKEGKWVMVVSPVGNPAKVAEGPAYDMVVSPVWSPDGKYIAYRARTGTMEKAKRFIVVADAETGKVIKEGPVSDEVWPPVWSADGKAAAYGARIGRELWWKVQRIN